MKKKFSFDIYWLLEALELKKILAHGIRLKGNLQTTVEIFWIFRDFHGVMRFKAQPAPPHEKFINGITNPESPRK